MYTCNPLKVPYHYQFNANMHGGDGIEISREAADPSLILYHGKYYLYPSMNLSVWVSEDLVNWESYALPNNLPCYDYAPDVCVQNDYVYFCASKRGEHCDFYRTKDPINGPYECIEGSFEFWDPHQFVDDDGRVYFYWGCSAIEPIYGVELDPQTRQPLCQPIEMIAGKPIEHGYERVGENNSTLPLSVEAAEAMLQVMLERAGKQGFQMSPSMRRNALGYCSKRPYIEGAWMTKHNGRYYLQYAFSGSQYNVYGDGVYESNSPLGPFTLAKNNPWSFNPGGFMPGAGHGSTLRDQQGAYWHTATMRISLNHNFERRVGLWPVGFDADGEMFCNQRYGDWPMNLDKLRTDPWAEPDWMLLSANCAATASSFVEGKEPRKATEENVRTWWRAATNERNQWLQVDLGAVQEVHAVHLNFADDKLDLPLPGELRKELGQPRYIEPVLQRTRWILEGSADGVTYEMLEDKSQAETEYAHDLVVLAHAKRLRYVRVTVLELPYDQDACISGLRVFGKGHGEAPGAVQAETCRVDGVTFHVEATSVGATGYNILWGHREDKLYHSWIVYGDCNWSVPSLIEGECYFVRVDAFNYNGITHGQVMKLET